MTTYAFFVCYQSDDLSDLAAVRDAALAVSPGANYIGDYSGPLPDIIRKIDAVTSAVNARARKGKPIQTIFNFPDGAVLSPSQAALSTKKVHK